MTQSNEPSIEMMNEVIALFYGLTKHNDDRYGYPHFKDNKGRFVKYAHSFEYHTSWDALMPVCKKIKAIKYPEMISLMTAMKATQEMNNGLVSLDLERTHKGVYEFITWYNQQKQTNEQ